MDEGTKGAMRLKLFIATVTPPRTQEGLNWSDTEICRNEPIDFESSQYEVSLGV